MKIVLVSRDFPPDVGGIQTYAHELAREFAARHEVTVIAPRRPGGQQLDAGKPYVTVRYPIGYVWQLGLAAPWVAGRTGARVAFHAQWSTAPASYWAQRLGLIDRYYVAAHGRDLIHDNWGPFSCLGRRSALRGAAAVFAGSRYTAGLARRAGVLPEKTHVVPYGVDIEFFKPRSPEEARKRTGLTSPRIVLTVGRLIPRKGVDTTIAAFTSLAERHPEAIFVIVGDGPYRSELEKRAGPLMRAGRIIFAGRVPRADLPYYYSLADIFIMPSREEKGGCVEGFGLVFLEANACGAPVIGTWSGGIPDAVMHGESGWLVKPGDAASLAIAMDRLLTDEPLRRRLSQAGRERARRFTWAAAAAAVLGIIERDSQEKPRR